MSDNFQKFTDSQQQDVGAESEQQKSKRQYSPVTLSIIVCAGFMLLVCVFIAQFVYHTQVVAKQQSRLAELGSQRAQLTAENVSVYLQRLEEQLNNYAGRPLLVRALAENDEAQLKQFAANLKAQLEHAVEVRIYALGEARLNADIFPPIRFSEMELIGLAERQKPVLPEAAQIQGQWIVTLVNPIVDEAVAAVRGTLVVHLKTDGLAHALEQNNIGLGEITLVQKFGNAEQAVVKQTAAVAGAAQAAMVKNSRWQVRFAPSYRLRDQAGGNSPLIIILLVIGSLFLISLSVWFGRQLGRRIEVARAASTEGTWSTIRTVASASKDVAFSDPLFRHKDILDVEITEGDEALLLLDEVDNKNEKLPQAAPAAVPEAEQQSDIKLDETIFRAYDIRGIYGKELTKDVAYLVGQALGSEAQDLGEDTLIVARDARLHSPQLTEFLIRGILSTGCHVLNIGTVPTPILYFACETLGESSSGVMVTASHNPAEYNGFKIVMNGACRSEQDIKAIRSRILAKNVYTGAGEEHRRDIVPTYIDTIFSDVALAGDVSIVIDAANAVPGLVAPKLFEELGCQVTAINCDLDGNFPNHPPDPSVEKNLQPLVDKVREINADIGIALDGDGDRLVVVTPQGKIIWPDRLLMLFAKDVVSRNPGADVVFDVKSTRHLNAIITEAGGRPIMWKTGHSPMKRKMAESGALLGGEYSGHIFIKDRWYGFDDGLYAAARLIEIASLQGESLDELFDEFPESPNTPEIRIPVAEQKKFELVEKLIQSGEFGDGKKTTLDGLRIDYSNGWGLVRASNTSADLTLRFEADDEDALHTLKSLFVRQLREIDSSINIDWDKTG